MKDLGMLRRSGWSGWWLGAVVLGMVLPVYGQYGPGTGDPNNPYQIWDPNQMNAIGANPGDWGKCFKLMADIDMSQFTGTQYKIIGYYNSEDDNIPFTGTFDGNEHKISNLIFTTTAYVNNVGLFGYTQNTTIQSLEVENVIISSGGGIVGGLVGRNNGTITGCCVSGVVSGLVVVGGLLGVNENGTIINCYANSLVNGTSGTVGGLVGYSSGTIMTCYATGSVSGADDGIGGLVGSNDSGTITYCYASGVVTGMGNLVGGLVGCNYRGKITGCYATGSVSGSGNSVGGLVGVNEYGTTTTCYATGLVSGTGSSVGGLVGSNHEGSVKICFWDIETSGQTGSGSGKGLTTDQMKTMSIFQNAGWADQGWVIEDGVDYPHLSWEGTGGGPIPSAVIPFAGNGTAEEPYLISTVVEFTILSWYAGILDKQIRLADNLDLSGVLLYPIGDLGPFTGVFDGNSYTISNAVIDQSTSNFLGLFGQIMDGGQIFDLNVENVNINGCYYVGGLAGWNRSGIISNCHVNGSIHGRYYVGSLVGYYTSNFCAITNCYTAGAVSGIEGCVGGLVGYVSIGTISDCYTTCSVIGKSYLGGLVGSSGGTLNTCYATGSVVGTGNDIGGLVGETNSGKITASYAISTVNGINHVGGLVGHNGARLTDCYTSGIVRGTGDYVGGMVGENDGVLNNCYAMSIVSGTGNYIGGLAGKNDSHAITSCFATGSVDGTNYVGGLVGNNYYGILTNCYATGWISGESYIGGLAGYTNHGRIDRNYACGSVNGTGSNIGGLLGYNNSCTLINNFWDKETSGRTTSAGGIGKTTAEMMTLSTFTGAWWDFTEGDGDGAEWMMLREGEDYPRLAWQEVYGGDIAGRYGVDMEDLLEVAGNWLGEGCPAGCEEADINGDGRVDLEDLAVVAGEWLKS